MNPRTSSVVTRRPMARSRSARWSVHLSGDAPPFRRGRDDERAAILGADRPRDQTAVDEPIEDAGQGRSLVREAAMQIRDRRRSRRRQLRQDVRLPATTRTRGDQRGTGRFDGWRGGWRGTRRSGTRGLSPRNNDRAASVPTPTAHACAVGAPGCRGPSITVGSWLRLARLPSVRATRGIVGENQVLVQQLRIGLHRRLAVRVRHQRPDRGELIHPEHGRPVRVFLSAFPIAAAKRRSVDAMRSTASRRPSPTPVR